MPNSCALGTTGTVMTIGLPIMDAHLKTVCQKKTRLTSPEVKALETLLKAWNDLERECVSIFSSSLQQEDKRWFFSQGEAPCTSQGQ